MISPPIEFRALRFLSAARLLTRGARVETGPPPGHPRIITSVIRLPEGLANAIHSDLASIAARHPQHHFYPPGTLHVSVSGFSTSAEYDLVTVGDVLDNVLQDTSSFEIELKGLNVSPSTVLIQAFASNEALAKLRKRISDALEDHPELRLKPRPFPSHHIAFANVLRFLGPVDARSLIRDVGRFKKRLFGTFDVPEIQLVATDKVLSDDRTEILRRFSIN